MNFDKYPGLGQALFEESGDPLILFDPTTRQVLDVNCAAQRLCGIGLRDLLNAPVSNLFRSCRHDGLGFVSFSGRKVHLPYAERGFQLRTSQVGVWVSVDVIGTRLAVKPWPLVLLTLRAVHAPVPVTGGLTWPVVDGVLDRGRDIDHTSAASIP